MSTQQPLYLYGFITKPGSAIKFSTKGLTDADIYLHHQGKVAAIVSHYPPDAPKKIVTSRTNMLAHQKVVEEAMQHSTLLPVQFGTVSASVAALDQLISEKETVIAESLETLNGKIELGLKAFWKDMEHVYNDISTNNPEVSRRKAKLGKSPSQDQLIAIGQLVEQALLEKKETLANQLMAPLSKIALEHTHGKILNEKMCLNASFLVEKEKETAFDEAINQLDDVFGGSLMFKYVGPLPVYNFVSLDLTEAASAD